MKIDTYEQLLEGLANTHGYTVYGHCADGGLLCEVCLDLEADLIESAIREQNADDWQVVALYPHWEGPVLECSHCSSAIDPSYSDD